MVFVGDRPMTDSCSSRLAPRLRSLWGKHITAIDIPLVETWDQVGVFFGMAEEIVAAGAGAAFLRAHGLLQDDRSEARLLAGLVLGEIALAEGPSAVRALDRLIAMLDDQDDALSLFGALEGIGFLFRAADAAPALRRLVHHESPEVRCSLAGALHSAHEPGDDATEAALILLSSDLDPRVREEAVRGLVRLSGWMSQPVRDGLVARTQDQVGSVAVTALSGLARAGEPIDSEALATILVAGTLESLPARARLQALEAAALAAAPRLSGTLETLRRTWRTPDALCARVLIAALAWCAPPETIDNAEEGRPPFDCRLARWLTGKRCLIGVRHLDAAGETTDMTQIYGEILVFNSEQLLIRDFSDGEEVQMPPDTSVFRYSPVGEYRLRSTGELVTDPDAECRWAVRIEADESS